MTEIPQDPSPSSEGRPRVDVVVLAHGDEPLLDTCVSAVLASRGVDLEVYVVDNGAAQAIVRLPSDPRITVLTPGRNTGFAEGCNLGATAGEAPTLVFVNSDAVVAEDAVHALARALDDPSVGLATGCVLLPDPERGPRAPGWASMRVNAAGNPVHWLGFSWCGGYGRPYSEFSKPREVASISGALFGTRRTHWDELGGFDPLYFAYHEDVDLSLRTWCRGLKVVYQPTAVCVHHYEFSKNPEKHYLLERNRVITWLTVPSRATLRRLALPLAAVQCLLLVYALTHRGARDYLRAWVWIIANPLVIRRRRQQVQAGRRVSDDSWLQLTESMLQPHDPTGIKVPPLVNTLLRLGHAQFIHEATGLDDSQVGEFEERPQLRSTL